MDEDLSGLPEGTIEAARSGEKPRKKGWIFTLDYPSYVPFVTYADNRELRKKMAIALAQKVSEQ
jgi:peptidyl-dipeptidase Dcp